MPAYKDGQKGTWYAAFYYQDWKGIKKKKLKRGFPTKKEALAWERTFLLQQAADLTMTFEAFVEIYIADKQNRLRENTWSTKEHIIRTKILPYFKEKRLCDIKPQDVIAWQNELLNYRGKNGEPYSPTYLKTLHSQFSAILNHAVRFYGLNKNAATTAGNMGSSKHQEMLFWTKEEYLKFAEVMMDKPLSYYAFEILYWCGIREGELLALTPADFDLDKGLLSITKSYQRLNGKDLLNAAKQYVVYRRQDDRLQGLLDAANAKIMQLESVVGELKRKVSGLVDELSNIEFWHRRELDEVKSESREVRRENLMLKREQKGLMSLLRRHGIDPVKEQTCEQERDER